MTEIESANRIREAISALAVAKSAALELRSERLYLIALSNKRKRLRQLESEKRASIVKQQRPGRAARLSNLNSTERARRIAILKLESETIPDADLRVDNAYGLFEYAVLDHLDEMQRGSISQVHMILDQLKQPGAQLTAIAQARLFLLGNDKPVGRPGKIIRRPVPNIGFEQRVESMLATRLPTSDPLVIDYLYDIMSKIRPGYPILATHHHGVNKEFSKRQWDPIEVLDGVIDHGFKEIAVSHVFRLPYGFQYSISKDEALVKARRLVRRLNVALSPKTFRIAYADDHEIEVERVADRITP